MCSGSVLATLSRWRHGFESRWGCSLPASSDGSLMTVSSFDPRGGRCSEPVRWPGDLRLLCRWPLTGCFDVECLFAAGDRSATWSSGTSTDGVVPLPCPFEGERGGPCPLWVRQIDSPPGPVPSGRGWPGPSLSSVGQMSPRQSQDRLDVEKVASVVKWPDHSRRSCTRRSTQAMRFSVEKQVDDWIRPHG